MVVVGVDIEDESTDSTETIEGGGGNDARIWTMIERKYIPYKKGGIL